MLGKSTISFVLNAKVTSLKVALQSNKTTYIYTDKGADMFSPYHSY